MTTPVFVIVLAAGSASRFGGAKQLAPIDGRPMVVNAVRTAARACGDRTILVTGHESRRIAEACAGAAGFIVVNERYRDGIGTSIAAAVSRLRHVAGAIVVSLADQPLVTAEHLRALVGAWNGADDEIVTSGFAGTEGPPALFGRGCFAELAALEGDDGGRALFHDSRFSVTTVAFEPAAIDVDTPADLRRISRSVRS